MGANISCHFCEQACESATIKQLMCCHGKSDARTQGLVYVAAHGPQQFVLLNTPFIAIKDWIVMDNMPFDTVTVFFRDPAGHMRALLHHEPHDVLHRMCVTEPPKGDTETKNVKEEENENESHPGCDIHQGALVEELLPPHLRAPILRFMADTLDGTFFQMHGLFNSVAKLIRTYPIADYNNQIIGGIMIVGTFTPSFDQQLQQYVLNQSGSGVGGGGGGNGPSPVAMTETTESMVAEFPSTQHLGRKRGGGGSKTL